MGLYYFHVYPTVAWLPHSIKPIAYQYNHHNPQHQKQRHFFELHTGISSVDSDVLTSENDVSDSWQDLHDYDSYERQKLDLQLLLLDNYDSYTFNLYSYLSTICKNPPIVIPNDAYDSWEHLKHGIGGINIDGVVISPGPGRPERKEDMGICLEVIRDNPMLPILGVCLGHQALGYYYNATVQLAPKGPVHGLLSRVYYTNDTTTATTTVNTGQDLEKCDLFHGIPQGLTVVRYHSLVVEFPFEKGEESNLMIEPIAWCKCNTEAECVMGTGGIDGNNIDICMALRHKLYPHYGVQFHPESVGTGKYGYQLLKNFCDFCVQCRNATSLQDDATNQIDTKSIDNNQCQKSSIPMVALAAAAAKYKVFVHKVSNHGVSQPCPELVFENLFASSQDAFWLDSSTGRKDADITFENNTDCPIISNSRFSVMGGNLGPLCKKVEYWGKNHNLDKQGIFVTDFSQEKIYKIDKEKDIISFLRDEILKSGISEDVVGISFDGSQRDGCFEETITQVPFDFHGGYVGYLGYEVWHDTLSSSSDHKERDMNSYPDPYVPTAAFLFADRSLVYDHWRDEWYLIGVTETSDTASHTKENTVRWMRDTLVKLQSMSSTREKGISKEKTGKDTEPLSFDWKRSKNEYSVDISMCHEKIRQGESYELCLTNQLKTKVSFPSDSKRCLSSSPFGLYKILRENNPAPFSSFMNFNSPTFGHRHDDVFQKSSVSICCSSPERFLSIKREDSTSNNINPQISKGHGWEFRPPFVSKRIEGRVQFVVESKPIKGTKPRYISTDGHFNIEMADAKDREVADDLQQSTKNRAENLMIVDLLRNDLSKVCEVGSVHVPKLMAIESFATVHQMVSTIRGNVDHSYSAIDVIAACFPGGSMTGAPKVRSVDILDELELGQSRGPYSGCLGYISLNGAMDMNIVIRTAVVTPGEPVSDSIVSWNVSIGAGGAITALSESDDEFDEMLLKARAVRKSVESWNNQNI